MVLVSTPAKTTLLEKLTRLMAAGGAEAKAIPAVDGKGVKTETPVAAATGGEPETDGPGEVEVPVSIGGEGRPAPGGG